MERRRFLEVIGTGTTAGVVGLAGCGSPGGDTDGTPGEAGGGETPGVGGETTSPGEESPGDGTPGNETAAEGSPTATVGTGPQEVTIGMFTDGEAYYFDPIGAFVAPGGTVTWVNESGSHSSTAYTEDNPQADVRQIPEDAEGWNSGILSESGAEFSHTFEVEGTYDYYCIPHKSLGMVGRLVVGSPGGPAQGSPPPDGQVPEASAIAEQGAISYDSFTNG